MMDVEMNKCQDCGRLIASDDTHLLCDVCYTQYDFDLGLMEDAIELYGQNNPTRIAAHTRLSLERVQVLLEHSQLLAQDMESDTVCTNCRTASALLKSKYCLSCQLALYKSLGDEAGQAAFNQSHLPADTRSPSLREALEEKRQRTGSTRLFSAPPSVKGR